MTILRTFQNQELRLTHDGKQSLYLYTPWNACNLNCYKCYVRSHLDQFSDYLTLDELKRLLERYKSLNVNLVTISGGEPLVFVDQLRNLIELIKSYGFNVRVETNGSLPDNLMKIYDIVDGIDLSLVLPMNLNKSRYDVYKEILFSSHDYDDKALETYHKNLYKSFDFLCSSTKLPLNILHTTRYPQYNLSDIHAINLTASLCKYPHYWTEFLER